MSLTTPRIKQLLNPLPFLTLTTAHFPPLPLPTTMASYLITGTSRGIGLKLAEVLAAKPASEVSMVFAATRTETDALKQLAAKSAGRIEIVSIDVTSEESVKQAASKVEQSLAGKGLDVLINNAGIMNYTPNGIETMLVAAEAVVPLRVSS